MELKSPFVRRVNIDGKDIFHLVAAQTDDTQLGFYHLQSEDLVNWQPATGGNFLVKPTTTNVSKAQAPEWIYSDANAYFFVYWCAKSGDRSYGYLSATKDWKRFSTPKQFLSPGYSAYDMHIEKTGDTYTGIFYNSDRSLMQTQISAIKTTGATCSEPKRVFSSQIPKSRGPQTFPALDDSGWFLLYNSTERNQQAMSRSGNPAENKWYPCDVNELSLPEEAQDGSVLVITQSELENLLRNFIYEECDVLPTAEKEPQTWKYQTASSIATNTNWTKQAFNDNAWSNGLSGFGAGNPPGSYVNTTWNTSVIRIRYHLDLTGFNEEQIAALSARIHHDEDVKVYFNGVLAFEESGYLTAYKNIEINQEAMDALTPDNNNVIAIECKNGGGGQYIDFGLSGIRPNPTGIQKPLGATPQPEGIYNLAAQRLSSPRQGINIVNGKKILY